MKRFAVTGLVIATSLLSVGVAVSGAAPKKKAVKPKKVTVDCTVNFSNQAPSGDTAYLPGSQSGDEYGDVSCSRYLGVGVQHSNFTLQDTGDKTGSYKQYFDGGMVSGTYVSSPEDSQAPPQSNGDFTSQSYTGTITLTKGTGVYKGAKSTKKVGTYNCTTPDGVHFTCKEHITIIEPKAKK